MPFEEVASKSRASEQFWIRKAKSKKAKRVRENLVREKSTVIAQVEPWTLEVDADQRVFGQKPRNS